MLVGVGVRVGVAVAIEVGIAVPAGVGVDRSGSKNISRPSSDWALLQLITNWQGLLGVGLACSQASGGVTVIGIKKFVTVTYESTMAPAAHLCTTSGTVKHGPSGSAGSTKQMM